MTQPTQAPDWASIILDLRKQQMTFAEIGKAMESVLTERMLKHYAAGAQPAHWRGELLIGLWCTRTGKTREEIPMCELVRGHRAVRRETELGPRLQSLPQWPAAPIQPAAKTRGKPGRKPKAKPEPAEA